MWQSVASEVVVIRIGNHERWHHRRNIYFIGGNPISSSFTRTNTPRAITRKMCRHIVSLAMCFSYRMQRMIVLLGKTRVFVIILASGISIEVNNIIVNSLTMPMLGHSMRCMVHRSQIIF